MPMLPAAQAENPGKPVPIDISNDFRVRLRSPHHSGRRRVSGSASRQNPRLTEEKVRALVARTRREGPVGFLREPRVNVLELNLALDALSK